MKLRPYPEYKDSGVEWLGKLPLGWSEVSLSRVLADPVTDGPHSTPEFVDEGVPFLSVDGIQDGELVFDGCRYISETDHIEFSKKAAPRKDDILMGKAASIGKIARVKTEIIFSIWSPLALIRVNQSECNPLFLEFQMKSQELQSQILLKANSNTQLNIGMKDIQKLRLALPPLQEQSSIATYLELETAKLETLISKQEKLIELLQEKRQAIISQAVTKGLNPDAIIKDSGVAWLGSVPESWKVAKIKWAFKTSSGGTPNTNQQDIYYGGDIPWIRSLDLNDGIVSQWEIGITEAALRDAACKILSPGTVLIAMYGGEGTIGKNGLLGIEAATNQAICALLPSSRFITKYVLFLMQHLRPYWMVGAEGARKDPNISQDRVRDAVILEPLLNEQLSIVEFLDSETAKIDELIKKANKSIELAKEHRTALISAAVTGKIDVREAA